CPLLRSEGGVGSCRLLENTSTLLLAYALLKCATCPAKRTPTNHLSAHSHEKNRSHHQAFQTRGSEGRARRNGRGGHDGEGGQRVRPPERPHRDLPRKRIYRRFPAQGESGDRGKRRDRRQSREHNRGRGQNRQDRRRQGIPASGRTGDPYSH